MTAPSPQFPDTKDKDTAPARPLACIVLAAGRGTRMKSARPKVMHLLAGRPLLSWVLDAARAAGATKMVVVAAPDMPDVAKIVESAAAETPATQLAIQEVARGTGDAVRAALPALSGFEGDALILLGDMPLISPATLRRLIAARHDTAGTALSVLGVAIDPPPAFGRLVTQGDLLLRIVEDKDCTPIERAITLCNTGAFCVDAARLAAWVPQIGTANAQGEYYITDLPEIAAREGAATRVAVTADQGEVRGVNTRADLAALEAEAQQRLRARAMSDGATLQDPSTTYFSWDTALGRDVVVEPNVFFGPGVTVADNVHIKAFSHFEGCAIGAGSSVGPFARLRPGSELKENVHIGNFVEIKNATLAEGVKAGHLAYIGDATVGARTNYSCGAVTANYDGFFKHRTVIGRDVMIGSNATLIAPVAVDDGAYVAAGTVVTEDVAADALALSRAPFQTRPGWAAANRETKARQKTHQKAHQKAAGPGRQTPPEQTSQDKINSGKAKN